MIGNNDDDSDGSGSEIGVMDFASMDFSGVDFDGTTATTGEEEETKDQEDDERFALLMEENFLFERTTTRCDNSDSDRLRRVKELIDDLKSGNYAGVLRGDVAKQLFSEEKEEEEDWTVVDRIRERVFSVCSRSLVSCIEVELVGIAALNLFLQLNYTGPSVDEQQDANFLDGINPHGCFEHCLSSSNKNKNDNGGGDDAVVASNKQSIPFYHGAVLSELSVDGEWPCPVCHVPYLLLVARAILSTLADPNRKDWKCTTTTASEEGDVEPDDDAADLLPAPPQQLLRFSSKMKAVRLWSARALVAHERLLQAREPSAALWKEAQETFRACMDDFCATPPESSSATTTTRRDADAATVMLEWGLAQHHFDRPTKGKESFRKALRYSGLTVEVTGAKGKRTKFQKKSLPQMLVKATSAAPTPTPPTNGTNDNNNDGHPTTTKTAAAATATATATDAHENKKDTTSSGITPEMVKYSEEEIRLEKIKFDDDDAQEEGEESKDGGGDGNDNDNNNTTNNLSILDQSILLSLCLDVKNSNPADDGLTSEEMGAYLARVLDHHDDWMVYSTALLERAWVEFESIHGMERSILQLQALCDQHTNRLTITQSTKDSIAELAPVQERLRNLHSIVYPPRWGMIQDLAERYAHLSIFSSAAELFTQVELWDEVVECYRRAGKEQKALEIVREQLRTKETPRMYVALGDLTNDPQHYEKAVALSNGRFYNAYIALGKHHFDTTGDLRLAAECYEKALKVRPLAPRIWFRLGTIWMRLKNWDGALKAFSEVVQQEPEEAEAWANVASVHMHNKKPAEAYPALMESLKHRRSNWRVWLSKLYTCLDLQKYDEAIQACHEILDLRAKKQASEGVPVLEEKCVRAIVGGALEQFRQQQQQQQSRQHNNNGNNNNNADATEAASLDSARRTLERVNALLDRLSNLSTYTDNTKWLLETMSFFHEQIGQNETMYELMMQEYRSLLAVKDWEKDDRQVQKLCDLVARIVRIQQQQENKNVTRSKLLVNGIVKRVKRARADDDQDLPNGINQLEQLLSDMEEERKSITQ